MSVGYKINIPVLNFILENGLKYNLLTDSNFVHLLEIKKKKQQNLTLSEIKTFNFIFLFFINIFFINS